MKVKFRAGQIAVLTGLLSLGVATIGYWKWSATDSAATPPSVSAPVVSEQETSQISQKSLEINLKSVERKLSKLDQKRRSLETRLPTLEIDSNIEEELENLQARIDSLPAPSLLLDPESGNTLSGTSRKTPRIQTPEWKKVMDNYERETGITRAEVEALMKVQ